MKDTWQKAAVIALAFIALLGLSALGQLNSALADGGVFPQAQPNFSGEIGSKVLTNAGGALQLGAACTGGAAGDVCIAETKKICLDTGCNSYIACSGANTCQVYSGGSARLQWSNAGVNYQSNVTAASVAIIYNSGTYLNLPSTEAASLSAPVACAANRFGSVKALDDNNDGLASQVCYCGKTNDSTYAWLRLIDNAACGLGF